MKVKCPACGEPVSAAHINIRDLVAVCPACDNVFQFDSAFQRQRRKIKPPRQFTLYDESERTTHIAFKWSWRTEPLWAFTIAMLLLVIALVMAVGIFSEDGLTSTLLVPLLMGAYPAYYAIGLLFNRTHYKADSETLDVYTEPFYFPRYGKKRLNLDEITKVYCKLTLKNPLGTAKDSFYHVFARTIDGDERSIAAYVNYEHAHFIVQELNAHLQTRQNAPARLVEDDNAEGEEQAGAPETQTTPRAKGARSL